MSEYIPVRYRAVIKALKDERLEHIANDDMPTENEFWRETKNFLSGGSLFKLKKS